jgi:signal transduction histidine kinase
MRERVKRLDGTLEIESQPGQGTRIAARVPTHAFDAAVES